MSIESARFRLIAALLFIAVLAAFAEAAASIGADISHDPPSGHPATGTRSDSALMRVDVCPSTTSIANDPRMVWETSKLKVAPTHNLQIGSAASGSPSDFSSIEGAAQLNGSGRIAVLDYGSKEIRIFSGTGQFLKRVGGAGEGPSEFRTPQLVPVAGRFDSIVVVDDAARRVTAFSAAGLLTSTRPTGRLPGGRMIGLLKQGNLINFSIPFGGVGGSRSRSSIRFQIGDLRMLAFDSGGIRSIQLAYDSTPVIAIMLPTTPNTVYGGAWIPFRVQTSTAAGSNSVMSTIGSKAVIREFDSEGCLKRAISVAGPLRPIPAGEYERWMEWGLTRVPSKAEARRLYGEVPRPGGLPAWQKLVVDSEAFVWAEVFRVRDDTTSLPRWNVFSPEGKAVGTVTLPAHVDVMQIGRDFILGIWKDADEIEHVRRYSLTRT